MVAPPRNACLVGDALEQLATLPDGCVQTCATSPPYWGLRDYGEAGQLGLESTPDEYVARMVEVFRQVRRVLRDDGTVWLNLGDSYVSGPPGRCSGDSMAKSGLTSRGRGGKASAGTARDALCDRPRRTFSGLKNKDLVGIPWRVAFALQADGWYLRSDIIWHKPNPMPSSVTDRPTSSHEYVFLLSKSARYYYDADAIAEPAVHAHRETKGQANGANVEKSGNALKDSVTVKATRNRRSVWTVTTTPYPGAHFACWPPKLVSTMIQAGTSEHGACADCGAPWGRVVERTKHPTRDMEAQRAAAAASTGRTDGHIPGPSGMVDGTRTAGWKPTCDCDTTDRRPCIVLDPFMGSGTTAQVAQDLGRHWIGVELNPDYIELQNKRTAQLQLPIL